MIPLDHPPELPLRSSHGIFDFSHGTWHSADQPRINDVPPRLGAERRGHIRSSTSRLLAIFPKFQESDAALTRILSCINQ